MTTPTHAETARELAADLNTNARTQESMLPILERYLTAAHAQGWDAAVEACASGICDLCKSGSPIVFIDGSVLHNLGALVNCDAAAIRELKGQAPK